MVPGFVADGMYPRTQQDGFRAPGFLGVSKPQAVGRAVVRAIRHDVPEVIVNPMPIRPALLLGEMMPRVAEQVSRRTGLIERGRKLAERRVRRER